jgi:hypothetical protein
MVWAQKEEEDYDPYGDEEDEKKDKWRPLLAGNYPYMPERTMYSFERVRAISGFTFLFTFSFKR